MKKTTGDLYAIYKNGEHKGNERGKSEMKAINNYIIASGLGEFINQKTLKSKYSAIKSVNGIHHYLIDC